MIRRGNRVGNTAFWFDLLLWRKGGDTRSERAFVNLYCVWLLFCLSSNSSFITYLFSSGKLLLLQFETFQNYPSTFQSTQLLNNRLSSFQSDPFIKQPAFRIWFWSFLSFFFLGFQVFRQDVRIFIVCVCGYLRGKIRKKLRKK